MIDPFELLRLFILALAIYREAAGEPWEGKLAVAQTIENRVNDLRWPQNYRDVILQPWQFSAFNKQDPGALKFPAWGEPVWKECVAAAMLVITAPQDFANGANHYLNPAAVKKATGTLPDWATEENLVATYGRHNFYKL